MQARSATLNDNLPTRGLVFAAWCVQFLGLSRNKPASTVQTIENEFVALAVAGNTIFTIIPMMFLKPAEKEDEVVNFLMVNFFEKVLSRSKNKEEPPM
ncbi:hypothetical protein Tco_0477172 [Tanacetum coccineum]